MKSFTHHGYFFQKLFAKIALNSFATVHEIKILFSIKNRIDFGVFTFKYVVFRSKNQFIPNFQLSMQLRNKNAKLE